MGDNEKQVPSKYHSKFPSNSERDYVRLTNVVMKSLKEVLEDNAGRLKAAIGDGTRFDSISKDNEKARKAMRMTAFSRTSQNIEAVFNQMKKELNTKLGFFDVQKSLVAISQRTQKLSISEFKRACRETIGLDLRDDFFMGELYEEYLRNWVSDNVDLIKTIPHDSLDEMKQIVFKSYVDGNTTTSIMQQIQHKYKTTKSYARFVARDQIAKLNGGITKQQHTQAGVSSYTWDDSGDQRVRKRHRELNGRVFSWDNSNPARNEKGQVITPGYEYQCRCCALPVFDLEKLPSEAILTKGNTAPKIVSSQLVRGNVQKMKPINKNGEEIQFNLNGMSEEGQKHIKDKVNLLSSEYNTSIVDIQYDKNLKYIGGKVDAYTGTVMQIKNSNSIDHEFFHTLDHSHRLKYKDSIETNEEFWKEAKKLFSEYKKAARNNRNIRISEYSLESVDEFMAEAFGAAKGGHCADPFGVGSESPYTQKALSIIDKYFKKTK